MLELVAASTIIGIGMIPALKLTTKGVTHANDLELSETLLSLCASKMEEEMARTMAGWDLNDHQGQFSIAAHPELRFQVSKSDSSVDGGLPGKLAAIQVVVWQDTDADAIVDSSEHNVWLATKLAKLTSYEEKSKSN
ncbi:MAG: hypothetical protein KDB00_06150 [Planctomycetales bacterium]|nr:hypothetical protein [Planctomycetales bacterium]